ncbi:MAG: RsmB/NOP family class I SAM-dependent RNA methyltransferase [Chlamydiota bacterium]
MDTCRGSRHILLVLESWEAAGGPLDRFLSHYFRKNRFIGAKNRRFLAETVFQLVRLQGLLDHGVLIPSWATRLSKFLRQDSPSPSDLPAHVACSFPLWYYQKLREEYGDKASALCHLCNEPAPITIRVNERLSSREALYAKWKGEHPIVKTPLSPWGITWKQRKDFFSMDEFRQGLFEVQDEGSQLIALFVDAKPREKILDYCSGSGGKSLAFAPGMEGKGQIYLHDIRRPALLQAKKRLKRAKVENAQITLPQKRAKNRLLGKMDKVLLDVPCSGSGTLRRNPEMKWRLEPENLTQLKKTQRTLFAEALPFLHKGGMLFYATCSVFAEENQRQVDFFCQQHPVEVIAQKQLLPQKSGHDGFFMAAFRLFC